MDIKNIELIRKQMDFHLKTCLNLMQQLQKEIDPDFPISNWSPLIEKSYTCSYGPTYDVGDKADKKVSQEETNNIFKNSLSQLIENVYKQENEIKTITNTISRLEKDVSYLKVKNQMMK